LENDGVIIVSTDTEMVTLSTPMTNGGTVEIQGGTLDLQGNIDNVGSGQVTIDSQAAMQWDSGTITSGRGITESCV